MGKAWLLRPEDSGWLETTKMGRNVFLPLPRNSRKLLGIFSGREGEVHPTSGADLKVRGLPSGWGGGGPQKTKEETKGGT